jgi:hypothetical protein
MKLRPSKRVFLVLLSGSSRHRTLADSVTYHENAVVTACRMYPEEFRQLQAIIDVLSPHPTNPKLGAVQGILLVFNKRISSLFDGFR